MSGGFYVVGPNCVWQGGIASHVLLGESGRLVAASAPGV